MDTLTHALSGALVARATEPDPRPGTLARSTRLWAGFWAAAFPDSDFVLRFFDPLLYLTAHRGVTHSILLLPLWALALAGLLALLYRGRYSWRAFYGVCALGIGAHIAGDVITSFGTMVFAPFSDWRAQIPATFIIDPYFTAIVLLGLIAIWAWKSHRAPAVLALATLAAYVGFQTTLQGRAERVGKVFIAASGLENAKAHAVPQPFSPFHWMVVVEDPTTYRLSYVSLSRKRLATLPEDASWLRRVHASYRPVDQAQWIEVPRLGASVTEIANAQIAWDSKAFARYRDFAMFPAVHQVDRTPGRACVTFQDLRFALTGRELPFRYMICHTNDGRQTSALVD